MMFLFWLIIIAAVALVVVLALNSTKQRQDRSPDVPSEQQSAEERVKERYAKGEIDRAEYKQIMQDLKE